MTERSSFTIGWPVTGRSRRLNVRATTHVNGRSWPRVCGNSIFAAEGKVAGRVDQVRCVELALIEHRERKKPLRASASAILIAFIIPATPSIFMTRFRLYANT